MPAGSPALPPAFDLAALPTAPSPAQDRAASREALDALREALAQQQELLYANRRRSLLVILQGMDASGKDSTIRRAFGYASPSSLAVHAFRAPAGEELAHDFLWRVGRRLPERGMIGIFNRSHYEALVYDPVQGLCDEAERQRRLQSVRDFERHLAGSGTVLCKLFLNIGKAEQKRRLVERITDPSKHWKLGPDDLAVRREFDRYRALWSETLAATHTPEAPWHVIPADSRRFRDHCVLTVLVEALGALRMAYPPRAPALRPEDVAD
ncbi:MAG TPA: PPK2 family polyphosphate kinase [Moraxellaceae bacterium]|nr:PPK2 family polyphosphate kinase [Moraxellaceae bacterium]